MLNSSVFLIILDLIFLFYKPKKIINDLIKLQKNQSFNSLHSISMSNARSSCITAAAGTGIGQNFLIK